MRRGTRSQTREGKKRKFDALVEVSKITLETLEENSKLMRGNPQNVLMADILGTMSLDSLALKNSATLENNWDYNVKLKETPKPVDQERTGTCYVQAYLNCLRYKLLSKFKLEDKFELSTPYLFFYDKIERANLFLENMWKMRDKDFQDHSVRIFTDPSNHLLLDGGEFSFASSLAAKYGILPKNVYAGGYNSKTSCYMNDTLIFVLNHMALEIFRNKEWNRVTFEGKKAEYNKKIYELVVKFLGEPIKPTDKFTWTYKNKDGKTISKPNMTAMKLYSLCDWKDEDKFILIHDPRHPETYYFPSYSEYATGMVESLPPTMINMPMEDIKKFIYHSLKDGSPVWMACDMGKYLDEDANTSDLNRFGYSQVLNIDMNKSKADELDALTSTANHAMLFNGVDVEKNRSGEVVGYKKWRIMNSWDDSGDDDDSFDSGYHRMLDSYVDKYLYMAVIDGQYLGGDVVRKILNNCRQLPPFIYKSTDVFASQSLRSPCRCCSKNKK